MACRKECRCLGSGRSVLKAGGGDEHRQWHAGTPGPPSWRLRLPDRLLRPEEAADLLGVEPATIRQWTYQRRLPVVHPAGGRAARYRLSVLLELIAEWERPALGPPPSSRR
jgi:excisionase family DNA binding protein